MTDTNLSDLVLHFLIRCYSGDAAGADAEFQAYVRGVLEDRWVVKR